ncbi:MarR family winged helix-turn-helix transcriptional regulator [Furfurilactobacillus siliginis]|uniref:MarR family transcriptional regulator n=1 Tax=Furfurilactobacillus siliginis TaxID=348151 RepID=A0A0R2LCG7_9LACO|nr:MarR family transcriptional regulator [Furfurilactobacillus siliginis]KRN96068.1 MarR family transcriptional regulator [Furfurilactobacillus siliginis]GEK28774.1 hypothetical protein LSI01_10850 [Furfurilactobacillus siliginis]
MQKDRATELTSLFLRVINRYNELEKMPFDYGTGVLLHPSESHTIEEIGKNPNINITKLAELQGITKGAVSKKIQQLRKRGLVDKSIAPTTENEVVLNLTDTGQQVFKAHQQFSEKLNEDIVLIYKQLSDKTIAELEDVGVKTEDLFLKIAEERK